MTSKKHRPSEGIAFTGLVIAAILWGGMARLCNYHDQYLLYGMG